MKKIITLLSVLTLLMFSTTSIKSQSYTVTSIPYNPLPYDSGIAVVSPLDDMWGSLLGIGFDFNFFGHDYQTLVVGTNSILAFDSTLVGQSCNWNLTPGGDSILPTPVLYTKSIMFPYQDVDVSLGGTVRHQVFGAPPNRKFVVSFLDVPYYDSQNTLSNCNATSPYTGQVILYEGSNNIEMYIQHKDACTDWNQGLAVMGIQNDSGTVAYTVPGRNNSVWTANNEGWLFSPGNSPAANLNRISGQVIADLNSDCLFDSVDYALRNKPVIFHNNSLNTDAYIYTDMLGYYSKSVDTGSYTFTTSNIASQFYTSNCPATGSYTVYFSQLNDSSDNNIFADSIAQYCAALTPGLWATGEDFWSALGTCDTGYVTIRCINSGVATDSVKLLLTLNDSTSILNSPVPYTTIAANQYLFDIGEMVAGDDTSITLMVKYGCDTMGTPYCFAVDAQGIFPSHCFGFNNHESVCSYVGVPFDPNAIYVASSKHSALGAKPYLQTENDDDFTYTVTFQNTGTAVAHNVKLEIPLSNKIDEYTLAPSIASVDYHWLVLNHKLIVDFTGIELPDSNVNESGSHGYFKFQLKQKPGNVGGDLIPHAASIYFDNNSAVVTNTATVEIIDTVALAVHELTDFKATLFPNPAKNRIDITLSSPADLKVYDILGQLVLSKKLTESKTSFDISAWTNSVYILSINAANGTKVMRLIKN